MANEVLVKQGTTQLRFFVTGSFSPVDPATNYTVGTPNDAGVLTLTGVLDTEGRQSTKVDLGTTRAARYSVFGTIDFTALSPSATGSIDYYWAPSASTTAGTGNIAGNSGVDGDAPDGALGTITLTEFVLQCQFIGSLRTHDGGVVQNGYVGTFSPAERFGQLVVVNNGGATFMADDVEMHQVMNPIVDEIQ